jgi:hypothetical protein
MGCCFEKEASDQSRQLKAPLLTAEHGLRASEIELSPLKTELDKILERNGVTITDILVEVNPLVLLKAFGDEKRRFRHGKLMRFIRKRTPWVEFGCMLCNFLVVDIETKVMTERDAVAGVAVSAILVGGAGPELLAQKGALTLLLSRVDSPLCSLGQGSTWCRTIRDIMLETQHKHTAKAILQRLDQHKLCPHLNSVAAAGLLTQLAWLKFSSIKPKKKGEEKFSLKAIDDKCK